MKIWTKDELSHLSPSDLSALQLEISALLAALAEGSPEHRAALASLDNIRWALGRPRRSPRPGRLRPPSP